MDRNRRRRFGQNFLEDAMARAIASDLPVRPDQHILEIGSGHGALTRHLAGRGASLSAVEIDPECAQLVSQEYGDRIQVYNEDFMRFDLEGFLAKHPKLWVAGNLPYNVATGILVRLVESMHNLQGIMAMVQYEVALRLCAEPGSSDYGSLSVFIRSKCDTTFLRKVGPEFFTPKPNVDSATVLLTPRQDPLDVPDGFFDFVQACFTHKRKRLSNSLTAPWSKKQVTDAIAQLGRSEHARAEEFSPEDFLQFYRILQQQETVR